MTKSRQSYASPHGGLADAIENVHTALDSTARAKEALENLFREFPEEVADLIAAHNNVLGSGLRLQLAAIKLEKAARKRLETK